MRLSTRSYPHPVVGNRDDVPGAAFQCILEMTTDKQNIYLDISVNCSSSTINRLLKDEEAVLVVHVECSNTMFRRAYEFRSPTFRCTVAKDNLNDAVEVNVFALAKRSLQRYRVDKSHSDYGNTQFDIEKAEILAVGEGQVFHVESDFDSLSRIGAIMQITEAQEDGEFPMRADFGGDKIVIVLSKKDFADYKLLKAIENVAGPITNSIVLPVLLEALHILKDGDAEDDCRWVRSIQRRIDELQENLESDLFELAQQILDLPLRRSLSLARTFSEVSSA
jgi:hypothetical protein